MADIPLPWERLLWSGRPLRILPRLRRERYFLTDFRLIRAVGAQELDELVLHDIGEVLRTETRLDRVLGTSTLTVHPRRRGTAPIVLSSIRRGAPLAALLELLSGDPHATSSAEAVRAALAWNPQPPATPYREAGAALAAYLTLFAIILIGVGLRGKAAPIVYAADDAIEPGGVKKSRQDIVAFMEEEVMPWARVALGPLKGGADRVTCETCHAADADEREWHMPSVSALPLPDVLDRGWEIYNTRSRRASAQRHLRILRRVGQSGEGRVYEGNRDARDGPAASSSRVRLYAYVRVQSCPPFAWVLSLSSRKVGVKLNDSTGRFVADSATIGRVLVITRSR